MTLAGSGSRAQTDRESLIDLERYFARELGLGLFVLALAALLGLSSNGDDALAGIVKTSGGPSAGSAGSAREFPILEKAFPRSAWVLTLAEASGAAAPPPSVPRTVPLMTLMHTFSALHAYMHGSSSIAAAGVGFFPPAVFVSGVMATWGLWCVVFGADPARISKRTGRDKHAARWPFGESERRREKKGL